MAGYSNNAALPLRKAALAAIASSLLVAVHGCYVNVQNRCPYAVTACAQSAADPIDEYQLESGQSQVLDFGRACRWPAAAVWASVRGECVAPGGNPAGANDRNLANLAEFNLVDPTDYYDVSNVNAYSIGLQIEPIGSSCPAPSCTIPDVAAFCSSNNQLLSLPLGSLACINTDGANGIGPTPGTQEFKDACPSAYSYNYDDPTSIFSCSHGTDYNVIFCP